MTGDDRDARAEAEIELGSTARSGARWQSAAQLVEAALTIGVTVVLARLVGPEVFGLVALLVAITGVVEAGITLPIGNAVVAQQISDRRSVSTAWWLAVTPAMAVAAGAVLIALIAGLDGDARFATIGVAAALPLAAGADVQLAGLQQQLEFRGLASARIVGSVLASAVAVALAAAGHGLTGLVARVFFIPLGELLAAAIFLNWIPSLTVDRRSARRILRYIRGLSAFNLLNQVMRRGDDVLVGAVLGSTALGYYSMAYRFIELPVNQVGQVAQNVALPTLVRISDLARFRSAFLRSQAVLVWVVAPIGICAMFLGDTAVSTFLGERWDPAGRIIQVFGGVGLIQAAMTQVGIIYLSQRATDLLLRWGTYATPVVLAGVLAGLPWGPLGVACGYLVVTVVLFYPGWAVPGPLIGLRAWTVIRNLMPGLAIALAVAAGGGLLRLSWTIDGAIEIAAAAVGASVVYWSLALLADLKLREDVVSLVRRDPPSVIHERSSLAPGAETKSPA